MASQLTDSSAWFSLLRYRADPTRDEARNVAVMLVDREGRFGGIRSAPISSVSHRLHEQGIVDAVVAALEQDFAQGPRPDLARMEELSQSLQRSLYLTEPQPVLVPDPDTVLSALYRAYVAPAGGGSRKASKSAVLDRVVAALRSSGVRLRRSQYVKDVMFDLVVDGMDDPLGEVLSFATGAARWDQVENDAGHFIFGIQRVGRKGFAVIEPPAADARESAREAHTRVTGWLNDARVRITYASSLRDGGPVQEVLAF